MRASRSSSCAAAHDPDHSGLPPYRAIDGTLITYNATTSLSYAASGLPPGAEFDAETATFLWQPDFQSAGEYILRFTATDDGDGTGLPLSTTTSTRIVVTNVNRAPELTPIAQVTIELGETLDVPVTASDADGNPITFQAANALVGYPLPEILTWTDHGDGQGMLSLAPTAGDRGEYAITIRATDDGDAGVSAPLTSELTFVIDVVADNDPPLLEFVSDAVAVVGAPLSLNLRARDSDQEPLNWNLSGLPAGAELIAGATYGTATLAWTPTFSDLGQHVAQVEVTDQGNGDPGAVAMATRQFQLTVRTTNHPPVLDVDPSSSVAEGATFELVLQATDVDGDVVAFSAGNLPAGMPWMRKQVCCAGHRRMINRESTTSWSRRVMVIWRAARRFSSR